MLQRAQSGGNIIYRKGFRNLLPHCSSRKYHWCKAANKNSPNLCYFSYNWMLGHQKARLPPEYVGFPRRRANRRTLQVVIVHRSTYNLTMDGEKASFFNMRTLGLPKFFCYFFISPPPPFRFWLPSCITRMSMKAGFSHCPLADQGIPFSELTPA